MNKTRQHDKFLHKIQQPKMTELGDNKEDEDFVNKSIKKLKDLS